MDKEQEDSIARNVDEVRARIRAAAGRAGRPAESVRLLAVTKRVGPERVAAVVRAGISELGENYVQEAREKIPEVSALSAEPLRWHLIGHLQSNKIKYSIALFSVIQSIDNYQLAQELGRQASKRGKIQPLLIEVNLAENPARAGVPPAETLALAEQVAGVPGLGLQGLMGMAPFGEHAEAARPYFRRLHGLYEALPEEHRKTLSMGMSGDFEIAIEEGATMVRIGTALFGLRGD